MGFQILNKDNQALTIKELDAEAAAFWGNAVDEKFYATPDSEGFWGNWFDMIGYKIHNPKDNYTTGWGNVKHSVLIGSVGGSYKDLLDEKAFAIRIKGIQEYLKPYFELIDHWEAKGYSPKKTDD